MNKLIFIFSILLITTQSFSQSTSGYNKQDTKPKVIIGIVIENMRPDYIQRYWNKFGQNGFKKIYTEGAICTNVNLIQHTHSYASGTASLFTGANPSINGIIGKTWYDRLKRKEVECTKDDYFFTVGADTKFGNASPRKLLSNTITDNLKINTQGKSFVFSTAINRESAIFAAGHSADGAFWFDPESGKIVSSSFYINHFPDWVRDFNNENYPERYSYQNWVTLLPIDEYTESIEDTYLFERGYFDHWNAFPHTIGRYTKKAKSMAPFKTTPFANKVIKDFAIQLMENEPIGEDNITDFITFIFSSMDYENNSFGPASVEMEDSYLYLDKYLSELISHAEQKYGKQNILFFLTSNSSASYPVEYLKEEFNQPVNYFMPENAIALLTSFLNVTYGQEKWIEHYCNMQIYLDHDLIKKHNINLNKMREESSMFINQFEGIQLSMPANQLETGNTGNGLLSTLYKSYTKNRSGDFLFLLKEGWQPAFKFKQINYTDQLHIPLVFFGSQVQPQLIKEKHYATDLAPTLCDFLQIPAPNRSQGNIILNIMKKN